jgi:hypothetical protein
MSDTQAEPRLDINVAEIMAASKERLVEEIVRSTEVRMKYLIDAALEDLIKTTVKAYYKAEIEPELTSALVLHKSAVLEEIVMACQGIGINVGNAITKRAIENLASSYKQGEMLKALFQ